MPVYRLHFLKADRSAGRAYRIECDDDREVIERAEGLHHAHGVDIWEGRRRVTRVAGSLGATLR